MLCNWFRRSPATWSLSGLMAMPCPTDCDAQHFCIQYLNDYELVAAAGFHGFPSPNDKAEACMFMQGLKIFALAEIKDGHQTFHFKDFVC